MQIAPTKTVRTLCWSNPRCCFYADRRLAKKRLDAGRVFQRKRWTIMDQTIQTAGCTNYSGFRRPSEPPSWVVEYMDPHISTTWKNWVFFAIEALKPVFQYNWNQFLLKIDIATQPLPCGLHRKRDPCGLRFPAMVMVSCHPPCPWDNLVLGVLVGITRTRKHSKKQALVKLSLFSSMFYFIHLIHVYRTCKCEFML